MSLTQWSTILHTHGSVTPHTLSTADQYDVHTLCYQGGTLYVTHYISAVPWFAMFRRHTIDPVAATAKVR